MNHLIAFELGTLCTKKLYTSHGTCKKRLQNTWSNSLGLTRNIRIYVRRSNYAVILILTAHFFFSFSQGFGEIISSNHAATLILTANFFFNLMAYAMFCKVVSCRGAMAD